MFGMKYAVYLRIGMLLIALYLFCTLNFPLYIIVFTGVLGLILIAFRGHAYEKIDALIGDRFPQYTQLSPLKKRIILIVCFLLIYNIFKQLIYAGLAFMGFDIQKDMMEIASKN